MIQGRSSPWFPLSVRRTLLTAFNKSSFERAQFLDQFDARHSWHVIVGNDEVIVIVGLKRIPAGRTICGTLNVVVGGSQHINAQLPQHISVSMTAQLRAICRGRLAQELLEDAIEMGQ